MTEPIDWEARHRYAAGWGDIFAMTTIVLIVLHNAGGSFWWALPAFAVHLAWKCRKAILWERGRPRGEGGPA